MLQDDTAWRDEEEEQEDTPDSLMHNWCVFWVWLLLQKTSLLWPLLTPLAAAAQLTRSVLSHFLWCVLLLRRLVGVDAAEVAGIFQAADIDLSVLPHLNDNDLQVWVCVCYVCADMGGCCLPLLAIDGWAMNSPEHHVLC